MIVRDDEYLDFSKVPESRGVPVMVYRLLTVGILGIFIVGASVCLMAGYSHMWPSQTTMRANLGQMTTK